MPDENLMVEIGEDSSLLFVVFSGALNRFGASRFEFQQTMSMYGHSRILCRDPKRLWYHEGMEDRHGNIAEATERLSAKIDELAPKTVIVAGNSTGGYAALLFGHLLQSDYVHAFSPQTCLEPGHVRSYRRLDTPEKVNAYRKLWSSSRATREYFDLAQVLKQHNGKTRYFIHYCSNRLDDKIAAERMRDVTGMFLLPHDCESHMVVRYLHRKGLLTKVLEPCFQAQLIDDSKLKAVVHE